MKTDIEIAQAAKPRPIMEIAEKLGIGCDEVELYGKYKAKLATRPDETPGGKLILVTAITPTPAGEGKTTMSIGLADGLAKIGKKVCLALREPSLGPVFGVKGGAAGGGYAQVIPMEDINLHFTGDIHAVGAANNLLAAMIDNHISHGNRLRIDPRAIAWRRCMDMNDRQLRHIISGLGGTADGMPREDGFDITVASEVMAIMCLSLDMADLKSRLARVIAGYTFEGEPVTAGQLRAEGAMCALLKDALKPNLVQTLEGTPALVHMGPFANIAHGCNSVIATKLAMSLADYAVTEAGFGADLGAEKFIDIKCRAAGIAPDACVIVATLRAIAHHGGGELKEGMPNLKRHIENMRGFGIPSVVAINRFPDDADEDIEFVRRECEGLGVKAVLSEAWARGGEGGRELASEVARLCEEGSELSFSYEPDATIRKKIEAVAKRVYRASGVDFTAEAQRAIRRINKMGLGSLPVCIAKTQYSFSDDPKKLNAPEGFRITVRDVRPSAGAGFAVALTGSIMTMPGLPASPAAENIDVDGSGNITGLF